MSLFKRLGRTRIVQEAVGLAIARYLRLVQTSNRFRLEPEDAYDRLALMRPCIVATWHGQHFMAPFARRPDHPAASLVSRSGDGELNAIALRHLGFRAIRGSGARGRSIREKGGAAALREMVRALDGGESIAITADVPKIARRCGEGVVTLARLSGRPIVPLAVATSRRLQFGSWDRASVGLPFGRGSLVIGTPIAVPRDADGSGLEESRRRVEAELDRVHARAYALVGGTDPGAVRTPVEPGPGRDARADGPASG